MTNFINHQFLSVVTSSILAAASIILGSCSLDQDQQPMPVKQESMSVSVERFLTGDAPQEYHFRTSAERETFAAALSKIAVGHPPEGSLSQKLKYTIIVSGGPKRLFIYCYSDGTPRFTKGKEVDKYEFERVCRKVLSDFKSARNQ